MITGTQEASEIGAIDRILSVHDELVVLDFGIGGHDEHLAVILQGHDRERGDLDLQRLVQLHRHIEDPLARR